MGLEGEILGAYTLGERLGTGGMGTVYRATSADGPEVAIKVLHPHLLAAQTAFKRFLREAELGRKIAHPNVVRTLEVDASQSRGQQVHFLVLEYVEGQTLDSLLVELGRVPEELCLHIGLQVAGALTAIHAIGAIHRDLKPANIIITPKNELKVMDLGVALKLEQSVRLSSAGDFLGSVLYAAPEQWQPNAIPDARLDLFALGLVLYELATGQHPHLNSRTGVPPSQINCQLARPASAIAPDLSPFFVAFLDKLIQAEPADRFAGAQQVHGILAAGEESRWWQSESANVTISATPKIHIARDSGIYGREEPLQILAERMAKARAGHGQVVFLEGEAGIGKTRLVDEFTRRETEPFQFLYGSYPPGGGTSADAALSTAFRDHLGIGELEKRLGSLIPDLSRLVPSFAALLGGNAAPDQTSILSAESTATLFLETTLKLAKTEPLVLAIDDLHFAPSESRAIVSRLSAAIAGWPVLIVGAYRPNPNDDWTAGLLALDHVSRVPLRRLNPKQLTELLTDLLGSAVLADQLGWEIARKSDGNPFFVNEILRDLSARNVLVRENGGAWKTTGLIRQIDTPHRLRDLIHARLSELTEEDRDLLEVAACAGFQFDPSVVAEAVGIPLIPALKCFRRLERDFQLIHPKGREYLFDHHQMHEAIYEDLFEQLRDQYHAALGDAFTKRWTEPTGTQSHTICRHFLRGREPLRAEPHVLAALRQLAGSRQLDQALTLASLALDNAVPRDPVERFLALRTACRAANHVGDADREKRYVDEAESIAKTLEGLPLRADAKNLRAEYHFGIAELVKARSVGLEAVALSQEIGDQVREQAAQRVVGMACSRMGRFDEALVHHRASLAICEHQENTPGRAGSHSNIAIQLVNLNRLNDAEPHYERAILLAKQVGETQVEAHALANYGRIYFERGDYTRAWDHAVRFREIARLSGNRRSEITSSVILSVLWTIFGALEEIGHELPSVRGWAPTLKDRWIAAHERRLSAWLELQSGNIEEAHGQLVEVVQIRTEIGDDSNLPDSLQELGACERRMDRVEDARVHLRAAVAASKPGDAAYALALGELANLEPAVLPEATQAIEALDSRGVASVRGPYLLWTATGEEKHLERARANLEDLESRMPPEYRTSARKRVQIYREVVRG